MVDLYAERLADDIVGRVGVGASRRVCALHSTSAASGDIERRSPRSRSEAASPTRYFKFNLYKIERNTFVAISGASLAGYDIEPDAGSANPYKIGADRLVSNRNFTLHVLAEDPPANAAGRPSNTVYVGKDEKAVQAGFRIYVSDKGYDGAGWGPADTPS